MGFALFFHNFSTFEGRPGIYLEDLFVRPKARGLGLGKALLAELARLAVERDCARVEWWVLDWNAPAIEAVRAWLEVHPNPERALSDGAQSLFPEQFEALVDELRAIAAAIGRNIGTLPASAGVHAPSGGTAAVGAV